MEEILHQFRAVVYLTIDRVSAIQVVQDFFLHSKLDIEKYQR